ncbi:hypothetical protein BGX33_008292 [Mortierella sp. NVP41]|nr:hypothetical protein BGX33_008292 [Mortierella sp. NVP41]
MISIRIDSTSSLMLQPTQQQQPQVEQASQPPIEQQQNRSHRRPFVRLVVGQSQSPQLSSSNEVAVPLGGRDGYAAVRRGATSTNEAPYPTPPEQTSLAANLLLCAPFTPPDLDDELEPAIPLRAFGQSLGGQQQSQQQYQEQQPPVDIPYMQLDAVQPPIGLGGENTPQNSETVHEFGYRLIQQELVSYRQWHVRHKQEEIQDQSRRNLTVSSSSLLLLPSSSSQLQQPIQQQHQQFQQQQQFRQQQLLQHQGLQHKDQNHRQQQQYLVPGQAWFSMYVPTEDKINPHAAADAEVAAMILHSQQQRQAPLFASNGGNQFGPLFPPRPTWVVAPGHQALHHQQQQQQQQQQQYHHYEQYQLPNHRHQQDSQQVLQRRHSLDHQLWLFDMQQQADEQRRIQRQLQYQQEHDQLLLRLCHHQNQMQGQNQSQGGASLSSSSNYCQVHGQGHQGQVQVQVQGGQGQQSQQGQSQSEILRQIAGGRNRGSSLVLGERHHRLDQLSRGERHDKQE